MRPTWERDPHTRLDLVERLKGLPDGITIRIVRLAPGLDYDVTVIAPRTAPMPAGAGDHAQPAGMNLCPTMRPAPWGRRNRGRRTWRAS